MIGPVTLVTVGAIPSTTIVVGDTAFAVVLPSDVESVSAGSAVVALLPALSMIVAPPRTRADAAVPY